MQDCFKIVPGISIHALMQERRPDIPHQAALHVGVWTRLVALQYAAVTVTLSPIKVRCMAAGSRGKQCQSLHRDMFWLLFGWVEQFACCDDLRGIQMIIASKTPRTD